MSTLPIETIRQIVEDIAEGVNVQSHYQHLLVLSLSCSLLRHEAQRVLFRNLALHPAPKACNKNIMLLDTLLSSPNRLALYAKTFKITYYGWPRPDSDETARLIKKLSSALQAMCNLKSLHVAHRIYRMPLLSSILEGLQFKLTSFCWSGRWDTVSHDASVKANFLRHQDEIEHLEILAFIDGTTLESIAADMCPRLRSLSAPYPVTQLILPNKKHVMSLRWTLSLGECFIPEDFKINSLFRLDLISTELANIRYLCYEKDDNKMPALQDIAPHLKSLVCLETNREEIKVDALSQLPRLKTLVLTASFHNLEQNELTKVAAACKTLERVDFQSLMGVYSTYWCDHSTKPPQVYAVDLDKPQRISWDDHSDTI